VASTTGSSSLKGRQSSAVYIGYKHYSLRQVVSPPERMTKLTILKQRDEKNFRTKPKAERNNVKVEKITQLEAS
jgi:hypothetical protein